MLSAFLAANVPTAHATSYSLRGAFDESHGEYPLGVAVDQSDDRVYLANFTRGIFEFESSGAPVLPEPFSANALVSGLAVDPENRDVYAYDEETQEIDTFQAAAMEATEVRHFGVTPGPNTNKFVQIASDAAGDVYYPNQAAKTVEEFAPQTEGSAPPPISTIAPTGAHELVEPNSVAVDSSHEKVYVVDSGNGGATPGRVQVFDESTGAYDSTLDETGAQDVAVDPVDGDVYVLDLNGEGSCEPLPTPCYRVRAFLSGESAPFAEFGEGEIGTGEFSDRLAVDHATGDVYVSVSGEEPKVLIFAPGTPPTVSYPTPSVTGLGASTAVLDGEVDPEGNEETACHFEYGTTTSYGSSVPCEPELVGEGSQAKPESVTISNLEANSEYHFRLVATTGAGAVIDGADQTFTTEPAPPTIFAGSVFASQVTQTDVSFNATINPQHQETHYYFNYSRQPFADASTCVPPGTTAYASAPAIPVDIGTGHSIAEELTGIPVGPLDLAGVSVVLHPGMESRALQPNTAYHFQVVAENETGNSCEPEGTFVTLPPDPVASTGGASSVTQAGASIAGAVTPGSTGPNSDTTWHFQYGTSTSYEQSVPLTSRDAGMGTSAVPVSTTLEGLASNTEYHYRLVASNSNADPAAQACASESETGCAPQIANGADRTFTTLPAEPLAGQTSGLSETTATLNGHVNPTGHPLQYRFQYGTSTAYGQSTPLESAGEGDGYTPVSAPALSGLTPGVVYHYRLVAIGAGGESYSPDATFALYPPTPAQIGNPFSPGQSSPTPFPAIAPLSTPIFPPVPTETLPPQSTSLTSAQKLQKALKACRQDRKKAKRLACEKQASKRYAPAKRKAKK